MCKLQIWGECMDNLGRSRKFLADVIAALVKAESEHSTEQATALACIATAMFTGSIAFGQQAALDAARAMSAEEQQERSDG